MRSAGIRDPRSGIRFGKNPGARGEPETDPGSRTTDTDTLFCENSRSTGGERKCEEPYARRVVSAHLPAVGVVHAGRQATRAPGRQQQESRDIAADWCKPEAEGNPQQKPSIGARIGLV